MAVKRNDNEVREYIIGREFLGKITIEELVEKIIKIHIEDNENQIKKK